MKNTFRSLLLASLLLWPLGTNATEYIFTKIADTDTSIPGGKGKFSGFSAPSLDGGNVAFKGFGTHNQEGFYTDIGGLNVVADLNTPIPPGGAESFDFFNSFSLDGGNVAFGGGRSGRGGIYTDIGGLNVIADLNIPIPPGGAENFAGFDLDVSLDSGNVAFIGRDSGNQSGIYTDIGGLTVVADSSTPIPGGAGNFTSFCCAFPSVSLDGGSVAFIGRGSGNQSGIYTDIGGLNVVAGVVRVNWLERPGEVP